MLPKITVKWTIIIIIIHPMCAVNSWAPYLHNRLQFSWGMGMNEIKYESVDPAFSLDAFPLDGETCFFICLVKI